MREDIRPDALVIEGEMSGGIEILRREDGSIWINLPDKLRL